MRHPPLGTALIALLVLAACAPAPAQGGDASVITIATIPDPQNYCTTDRLDAKGNNVYDETMAMAQLDAQLKDIVAQRPDFVLIVGDLTDTTGGPDENSFGGDADDPNSAGKPGDHEWRCYVDHVVKPLETARLPYLEVTGNHDSCIDYERWRPRAEFLKKPWAYAAAEVPNGCGKNLTGTEQRAALFQTALTPICVIGVDFLSKSGTDEHDFIVANHGCGAGHPTIILRHSRSAPSGGRTGWMDDASLKEIFMTVEGHEVSSPPFRTMSDPGPIMARGGFQYVFSMINMQEVNLNGNGLGCVDAKRVPPGTCMHTGLSWWGLTTITPAASRVKIQARAPWLHGATTSTIPRLYQVNGNKEMTLSPSWCSRFPKTKGC